MLSELKSAPALPPPHPVVRVYVQPHSLSYSLSRDDRQIKEENNLAANADTFAYLAWFCVRGGFFDVRVVPECNHPAVQDMCEVACKHYGWTLYPCQ